MKKFIFCAAAAIVALASCSKTQVVYNSAPEEISFKAVTGAMTKAPVEGSNFTHSNMQVGAFLAAGDGVTVGRNYFGDVTFTGTGTFTGGEYWPISAATLNFLAVAPEVSGVTTDFNASNHASASTTTVTGNETNQHDVMYSVARQSKNAGGAPSNVVMTFNHAYAWLDFTFKKSAGAPNITINSITVNGVSCNGVLNVTVTNADKASGALSAAGEWTPAAANQNLTVPASGTFELTESAVEYNKGILLIPEDPMTSFVINYTIDGQIFDYTYTPDSPLTWTAGKRYVYNISMNPALITIAPEVTPWTDDSDNVTIN